MTTYFVKTTDAEGSEIWATDGTPAGTHIVTNIGTDFNSVPTNLINFNGELFFDVSDGVHGDELWKTDGTTAGTMLVKDVNPGAGDTEFENFLQVGSTLYFVADDGVHGKELWKSDGTAAGTVMVKDLVTQPDPTYHNIGSDPNNLTDVGGTLFFRALNSSSFAALYATDGTAAGTIQLTSSVNIADDEGSVINFNGKAVFLAGTLGTNQQIWISDGTVAGTHAVASDPSATSYYAQDNLTLFKGAVYFRAYDSAHGLELWKTDGTEAGTVLVKDCLTGSDSSYPDGLTVLGDRLLFWAASSGAGYELWSSDGTAAGTVLLKDINPGAGDASAKHIGNEFTKVGDKLYFVADDGTHGGELWVTDGTAAGTKLVKDIDVGADGSNPHSLTASDGKLVFAAHDANSTQLFVTDGTAAGTVSLGQIQSPSAASLHAELTVAGSTLYFVASDDAHGSGLWSSDGTTAGTHFVGSLTQPNPTYNLFFQNHLVAVGADIYTAGQGAGGDIELWKSTNGGAPQLLKDINASGGSKPQELTAVGTTLFFSANDGVHGNELWKSDGTAAGTVMVKDINPGAGEGVNSTHRFDNFYSFTALGSKLMFVADDGVHGRELWTSNGTAAGTLLVKDIATGAGTSSINHLTVMGSNVYFSAYDDTNGTELWKSNGTAAGTVLVKDIEDGDGSSTPDNLTVAGSTLFFTASKFGTGDELWKSDGTAAGTVLVKDIGAGNNSSYIQDITAVGSQVFFTAEDSDHGRELWVSNGTSAGTTLVKDIDPSTSTSNDTGYAQNLIAIGNTLFFTVDDGVHGRELWKSDGTAAGTTLVKEITAGASGALFEEFEAFGGKLYFIANDQIWMSDGTSAGTKLVANSTLIGTSIANVPDPSPPVPVPGTSGDDTLVANADHQAFSGLAGTDLVSFASSPVGVTASLANPSINTGFAAGDTYSSIEGFIGSDKADNLIGDGQANKLDGGLSNDTLDGGAGADTMTGGLGNDTFYVDNAGDKVIEAAGQGTDTVHTTLASHTLAANVERLYFDDAGNHTAKGNELSNLIYGNAGLDKFLIDAGGNDTFSGGGGEDTFDARSSATGMVLRLDAQANNAGSVAGDTFAAIEKFFGSDTAGDAMTTGAARAKFFGYGGNDTLTGGSSIDALSGGAGNDSLVGNGGQDALDGGVGNDTMTGGAGADTFTFVDAAFGKDVITDFEDGVDLLKVFSAVADSFSDFTVTGNGTHHVVLTLVGATANTVTLDNASANITVSAADFLFY